MVAARMKTRLKKGTNSLIILGQCLGIAYPLKSSRCCVSNKVLVVTGWLSSADRDAVADIDVFGVSDGGAREKGLGGFAAGDVGELFGAKSASAFAVGESNGGGVDIL